MSELGRCRELFHMDKSSKEPNVGFESIGRQSVVVFVRSEALIRELEHGRNPKLRLQNEMLRSTEKIGQKLTASGPFGVVAATDGRSTATKKFIVPSANSSDWRKSA